MNIFNKNEQFGKQLKLPFPSFTDKDRLVAEETERCTKQVTTLKTQVDKLQADLKSTKVNISTSVLYVPHIGIYTQL